MTNSKDTLTKGVKSRLIIEAKYLRRECKIAKEKENLSYLKQLLKMRYQINEVIENDAYKKLFK